MLRSLIVINMEIARLVTDALKLILPAYCANAIPVIAGGGLPIDFGKNFLDGKPIFGMNKTFRGLFFGLAFGTAVGLIESVFFHYHVLFGLLMSLGALFGDLLAAFVKRRIGLAPGELLPIIDQVDFILGAILFSIPVILPLISWELVLAVMLITPPLHLLTNFAAYKLDLKSNPW